MRLQDFSDPFDDLSVHIEDEELLEQAAALEPTLLHGGSRVGAAVWISLVSTIAGAFAGATFSDEVRSSWTIFIAYLVVGAVILRFLNPLSKRLVGETIAWQAALAFFWSFLLAMVALLGAKIDTRWLSNTVSIGGGLFVGLMHGSFGPGFIKREEIWMFTSLPLGALAAWSAAGLQRAFQASANPPWSEAYVGTMAACVFMVPMAVLMATLSSKSAGLAKMATLYLHNQNFTAKAIVSGPGDCSLAAVGGPLQHAWHRLLEIRGRRSRRRGLPESERAVSEGRGGAHESRRRLHEAGGLRPLD